MSAELKRFFIFSGFVLLFSVAYSTYVLFAQPPSPEQETLLSEIGEGIGELAMWAFVIIYARTLIKIFMGKGGISRRLLPNYVAPQSASKLQKLIVQMDRSHIYVGVAALALALIHIAFMGLHAEIILFPLVLALVIWQGVFGMFLSWKGSPRNLKKWSYSVHAQLITGVGIGIFSLFAHMLIGD